MEGARTSRVMHCGERACVGDLADVSTATQQIGTRNEHHIADKGILGMVGGDR